MTHHRRALFLAGFLIAGALGCQAILGIDDTTLDASTGGGDGGANDGGSGDGSQNDSSSNDGGSDAHIDVDAGTAVVSVSPSRVFLREGDSADLTVTVTRLGYDGAVVVALADFGDAGVTSDGGPDGGGANGVGANPLTIPAGQTTGTITLSADPSVPVGLSSVTFAITTEGSSSLTLPVMIAGATGTLDTTFGTGGAVTDQPSDIFHHVVVGDDDSPWVLGQSWDARHYTVAGVADSPTNAAIASTLSDLGGSGSALAVSGSALVVGGSDSGVFVVRKMSTAGIIDTSFAQSGTLHAIVGANFTAPGTVGGLAFASNGDVLVAGYIATASPFGIVYRVHGGITKEFKYTSASSPAGVGVDPAGNVGVGGTFTTVDGGAILFGSTLDSNLVSQTAGFFGSPAAVYAASKAVVSAGSRIAVSAETINTPLPQSAFAIFDSDDAGAVHLELSAHNGTWDDGYHSISVDAQGRVVLTGTSGGSQSRAAFMKRMTESGTSSTTLYSKSDLGGAPDADFYDTAIDSWGRIYVVGDVGGLGAYLARIWP